LKKLIKYENQKSSANERDNVKKIDINLENKVLLEKKVVLSKNHCKNSCCIKKDVFERLYRPSSKICPKAVSTIGVQTDLPYKQTSKIYLC